MVTQHLGDPKIDAASALWQGKRDSQQDTLASNFALGSDFGIAVLADGMGGHPAGGLASRIAVTEVFSDLMLRGPALKGDIGDTLFAAANAANRCLAAQVERSPASRGMGTTLLALVIDRAGAHWLSVGDSWLLLWRGGEVHVLNRRHSMADALDRMVSEGKITFEESRHHPDRHALTSCLNGAKISQIDCPDRPLALRQDDILLLASDGIETLTHHEITEILTDPRAASAATLAAALLDAVVAKDRPEQDNLSLTVIRPLPAASLPLKRHSAPVSAGTTYPTHGSVLLGQTS